MKQLKHILFTDEKLIKFLQEEAEKQMRSFSNLVTFVLTIYMKEKK